MARLKDRLRQIPGGLKFRQPETGWDSSRALPPMPSLRALAQALIQHRKSNPHQLKLNGWSTVLEQVEDELDVYNAKICIDHGWTEFVLVNSGEQFSPKPMPPLNQLNRSLAEGVAAVRVGAKIISSWLGEGGNPVARDEAERRAAICATCPKNDRGDWTRYFTQPASDLIRKQLGMAKDLNLMTSKHAELEICSVCACPLKLKVWTPLVHILKHINEATKAELDPRCWITK